MNNPILILLVIVCIAGSIIYKKWINNSTLRKLYEYKISGNTERFIELIDSPFMKFNFSRFTLLWMKMNYYLDCKMNCKVEEIFKNSSEVKMNAEEKVILYFRMFVLYIEERKIEKALAIEKKLTPLLTDVKNEKMKLIKKELKQLTAVYCTKDISVLETISDDINQTTDEELKSVGYYRLAVLYNNLNDNDKVAECLNLALSLTNSVTNKSSLKGMINDHGKLS